MRLADRSLSFSSPENVQVAVQPKTWELLSCRETFKVSFKQLIEEKPLQHTASTHSLPVQLASAGSFLSIHPQKGGCEPWEVCRDGSFPRCPFDIWTICPFPLRKCADKKELIVFSPPGLSQEDNALWVCRTAPGSQRTGTTLGTQRRKSSIGDQIGLRIRLDQPWKNTENPGQNLKPRKITLSQASTRYTKKDDKNDYQHQLNRVMKSKDQEYRNL